MKTAGILILSFIGFIALYFILGYTLAVLKIAALPLFTLTTKVNNNAAIINKTYDANNQIYNYHWFKETQGSIDALANQIDNAQQSLDSYEQGLPKDRTQWAFEDRTEDNRLRAVVLGLKNQRESLVNEYNARANEADRSIFQNGLKTYIPLD
jgi:virulence-associated protein VapD